MSNHSLAQTGAESDVADLLRALDDTIQQAGPLPEVPHHVLRGSTEPNPPPSKRPRTSGGPARSGRDCPPSDSLLTLRKARIQLSQLAGRSHGRVSLVLLPELGDLALHPECFHQTRGPQELFRHQGRGCRMCDAAVAPAGPDERCVAFYQVVTLRGGFIEKATSVGAFFRVEVDGVLQPEVLLVGVGSTKGEWWAEPRVGRLQWASSQRHNIEIEYQKVYALSSFLTVHYSAQYHNQTAL